MNVRYAMMLLRMDALERGMMDLAIAYGWSAIRLGVEELDTATLHNSAISRTLPPASHCGKGAA